MTDGPQPISGRQLRRHEVTLLAAAYWPYEAIDDMVDIARLESGWRTDAHNTTGEDSRGLWQVNAAAWPQYTNLNLFDPQINAWCAYQVWKEQGYHAWYNSSKQLGLI